MRLEPKPRRARRPYRISIWETPKVASETTTHSGEVVENPCVIVGTVVLRKSIILDDSEIKFALIGFRLEKSGAMPIELYSPRNNKSALDEPLSRLTAIAGMRRSKDFTVTKAIVTAFLLKESGLRDTVSNLLLQ